MQPITHNGPLAISTGRSRTETEWNNIIIQWGDLVQKLGKPHRTPETYAQYIASPKAAQDAAKDVGGFVGGHVGNGRRIKGSVTHRQLVTLDVDFATATFWDDYLALYSHAAACIYSTHKHAAASPRLRLLMPLSRAVSATEYEAISMHIANTLGIAMFDSTTFQPERLMYWPSASSDGDVLFTYNDAPWLNADDILLLCNQALAAAPSAAFSTAPDVSPFIKKQGDPLQKPGLVGLFCRAYNIHQAINIFLPNVYTTCPLPGRYTYMHGTTSAGLITYNDVYAYSHHSTDPFAGKLLNAFDIVRLHLYSHLDAQAKPNTVVNRLPSYMAMMGMVSNDKQVKMVIALEKHQIEPNTKAQNKNFATETTNYKPQTTNWFSLLDVDKKGNYTNTINNLVLILENDEQLAGCIAYDDFQKQPVAQKPLPWRDVAYTTRYLTDMDDANLHYYFERHYSITAAKLDIALGVLYERTKFHPVRDYLNGLVWDGQARLDAIFIDYLGAEDSDYVRTVSRKAMVAAVARVMQPGIKFDNVLTFISEEGMKKSSLVDKLGRQWFSDSFITVQGKEAFEQLQGVWLVEMAELSGLKQAEIEAVKHFISKREDRYRVAYGRRLENFPRQCVFFGTTNKIDFLRGSSGNRRFWPVQCIKGRATKDVFTHLTDDEINQLWAEAVTRYQCGEALYLDATAEAQALAAQKEHSETDERAGIIQAYLDTPLPDNWYKRDLYERRTYLQNTAAYSGPTRQRTRVCAAEIWCEALGGLQKDMGVHNTRFIHDVMRNMQGWEGYKSKTLFSIYGVQRSYCRKLPTQ